MDNLSILDGPLAPFAAMDIEYVFHSSTGSIRIEDSAYPYRSDAAFEMLIREGVNGYGVLHMNAVAEAIGFAASTGGFGVNGLPGVASCLGGSLGLYREYDAQGTFEIRKICFRGGNMPIQHLKRLADKASDVFLIGSRISGMHNIMHPDLILDELLPVCHGLSRFTFVFPFHQRKINYGFFKCFDYMPSDYYGILWISILNIPAGTDLKFLKDAVCESKTRFYLSFNMLHANASDVAGLEEFVFHLIVMGRNTCVVRYEGQNREYYMELVKRVISRRYR